jgi:hypothetical protein
MNQTFALTVLKPIALLFAAALLPLTMLASPPDAPSDYETLTTGLGLGILFEPQLGQGPSTALNSPYTAHHGDVIEAAGFTSVRLRIDMDQFTASSSGPNNTLSTHFMIDLQFAVTNLLARRTNSFYVLISPKGLEDGTLASELLMSNWWNQIAFRFSNTTHRLIFNLMNEPLIRSGEFTNLAQVESMYRALTTAIRPSNPTRYLVYAQVHDEYMNGATKVVKTPYSDSGPGETDFIHFATPTNAGPYRIYDSHFLGDETPSGEDKRAAKIRQAWEFRQYHKYPVWSGAWNYGAWNTSWSTAAVARVTQMLKDANIPGTYLMFNSSQTSIYDPVGSDRDNDSISDEWTQPAYPPIITARNPIVWNSHTPYWTNSFHPQSDSYVKANTPTDAPGETAGLQVRQLGGSFERTTYLKFNLARQQPGTVLSAILKIKSRTLVPGDTIQARLAAHSEWDERSLNYNTRPAVGSTVFDSKVVNTTNTWYEFDVTAAITNNGIYTLALTTPQNNLTEFFSRDQGDPDWLAGPDLIVVVDSSGYRQLKTPIALGGGNYQFSLRGTPGENYALEHTTNLPSVNWQPLMTNQVGLNGQVLFTNTPATPADYFRARLVP